MASAVSGLFGCTHELLLTQYGVLLAAPRALETRAATTG